MVWEENYQLRFTNIGKYEQFLTFISLITFVVLI